MKNLDSYCFVASLWLLILEKWCKCTFKKGNKRKNVDKNSYFFGVLKVKDENSRIHNTANNTLLAVLWWELMVPAGSEAQKS